MTRSVLKPLWHRVLSTFGFPLCATKANSPVRGRDLSLNGFADTNGGDSGIVFTTWTPDVLIEIYIEFEKADSYYGCVQ
jgi:hypothetical protein